MPSSYGMYVGRIDLTMGSVYRLFVFDCLFHCRGIQRFFLSLPETTWNERALFYSLISLRL